MSLAFLAIGTAVPDTYLTQAEAIRVAQAICCRTQEQATWLPGIYEGSGIERRHLAFEPDEIQDVLQGTQHSASPFLPDPKNDHGPTTGVRMQHYARHAPRLAVQAGRAAFQACDVPANSITHLVT